MTLVDAIVAVLGGVAFITMLEAGRRPMRARLLVLAAAVAVALFTLAFIQVSLLKPVQHWMPVAALPALGYLAGAIVQLIRYPSRNAS